ncbi:hypothetical protein Tco_1408431 [Tanacetum coccineum]
MRRDSKGYTGVEIPLFPTMLVQGPILQGEGSTVPVESHPTPLGDPTISQPPLSSPSRVPTPPHDSPLLGGEKIREIVKSSKARRRAKIVVSDDEDVSEDSSKQGRMIEDIDQDAGITLVTPTKASTQVLSAAKVLTDAARVHTYSRRRRAVSTGSVKVSTVSRIISTAKETVSTYGASMPVSTASIVQESTSSPRASKDKGKAIITEFEPKKTTTKLKEIQERVGYEAAIRLQEHLDE